MTLSSVDIQRIEDFYATPQGRVARRVLQRHFRLLWPNVTGQRLLGLGYAMPFLRPFMREAERCFALLPADQATPVTWPNNHQDNLVALSGEASLPLESASVDRVLMIHGLETTYALGDVLQEVWRVLAAEGRFLLIVPNRTGLWARNERTPFGHGHPFSMTQAEKLLSECKFDVDHHIRGLFVPPFRSRMFLTTAGAWEHMGSRFFPAFGGVNIIEGRKRLYAGMRIGVETEAETVKKPVTASATVQSSQS